jgi:hypothetical protein
MNELDYVRDNRLRLWFLLGGLPACVDQRRAARREAFAEMMALTFARMGARLSKRSILALVVGDSRRGGDEINSAELVLEVFQTEEHLGEFELVELIEDAIPDIRRSRRDLCGTKRETIVVFRKRR